MVNDDMKHVMVKVRLNSGQVRELNWYSAQTIINMGAGVVASAEEPVLPNPFEAAPHTGGQGTSQSFDRVSGYPKVTAICPTYNRRKYIPRTISMFLAQTYVNSELLIVDDSIESIEDLVPKDNPRIRYLRIDNPALQVSHDGGLPRLPVGVKRNICCENALGDVIVHWDDDDWQAPGRIAHQVQELARSGKSVLSYFNILYYNEDTSTLCRCWPHVYIGGIHGATLCYTKKWWAANRFKEWCGGEDTDFGNRAKPERQIVFVDAQKYIVTLAHGPQGRFGGGSLEDRSNTCETARYMGHGLIPKVSLLELPKGFFDGTVEIPASSNDLVIGVVKNYDWAPIRPFVVSLAATGYRGSKVLLVENISREARLRLADYGFQAVDFATHPVSAARERQDNLEFGRTRFLHAAQFLAKQVDRVRNVIWCDVRDQIFQADPGAWLEANVKAERFLIGAHEGWKIRGDGYNDTWAKVVAPTEYEWLRECEALCSGTFAGDGRTMLEVFTRLHTMYPPQDTRPLRADQAMFSLLARTDYKGILQVPRLRAGFAVTCCSFRCNDFTSYAVGWNEQEGRPAMPTDLTPTFDKVQGLVLAPETGKPFCCVHQYDRDANWKQLIERKYAQ